MIGLVLLFCTGASAQDDFTLGNQALSEGRVADAQRLYQSWLERHPKDAFAIYNLSLCGVGDVGRCLELDPPLAYGMVFAEGEVKPVNLLRLRAGTRLASSAKSFAWAQATSDWELTGDSSLALVRAQVAPKELQAHFYQDYLESALISTGRTDQVAVWGPGTSFTLSVSPEGRLSPLGVTLPPTAHALSVTPEGYVRCFTLNSQVTVTRVRLADPVSKTLQGFSWGSSPDSVWEELRGLGALEKVARSPFLSLSERRELLLADDSAYATVRLARLALEDASVRAVALERLRRVLEVTPFDEGDYLAASLELLAGKVSLAEGRLQRLGGLEPARARPWRLLVALWTARGEFDRALQCAEQYGRRFANDPHPRYLQADLLARLGRVPEALGVLQGLSAWVEPLYLEARLAGRSGQVARQKAILLELLGKDPWPYRAERLLAGLYDRLGETERAIELYKRYLRSIEAACFERQEYVEASARFKALTSGATP